LWIVDRGSWIVDRRFWIAFNNHKFTINNDSPIKDQQIKNAI